MQFGSDSQGVKPDGPSGLLVADISRHSGAGAPIFGKAHVLVGDGLAAAPGGHSVRKQDTHGPVGAVGLDWLGATQRLKLPSLGLVRDHGAKDAHAELGAGCQTVRKLGGWVSQYDTKGLLWGP